MVPTFPTTINGLFLYLSVALPYLGLHVTRFGVDAAKVAAIMALYGSADTPDTYLFYKALWDDESSKRTKIVKKCLRSISDTLKKNSERCIMIFLPANGQIRIVLNSIARPGFLIQLLRLQKQLMMFAWWT